MVKKKKRKLKLNVEWQSLKLQIDAIVEAFNKENIKWEHWCPHSEKDLKKYNMPPFELPYFAAEYEPPYVYINLVEKKASPRGRIKYTGDFNNWKFAIYKYSDCCYDEECFFFDGAEFLDGTVSGALKASYAAY